MLGASNDIYLYMLHITIYVNTYFSCMLPK